MDKTELAFRCAARIVGHPDGESWARLLVELMETCRTPDGVRADVSLGRAVSKQLLDEKFALHRSPEEV